MQVKYYAYFSSKHEKTEFLQLIRNCRSDLEAITKVMDKYPHLTLAQATGLVDNFKTEIKK